MRFPEGRLKDGLRSLRRLVLSAGIHTWFQPRRLNGCGCGLSKTGTHSIAGIFENYRSAHHPDPRMGLKLAVDYLQGDLSGEKAEKLLRRRDRALWLEMESSSLAGIVVEPLVRACPDKKFILTVRDVYSWFNSWADQNLNMPVDPGFAKMDAVRLQPERFPPQPADAPLVELGFFSLRAYFALWRRHTQGVLDTVPRERLFIVRTSEIIESIPAMAEFMGVAEETLRPDRGWQFASRKKHHLLARLDPHYVRETAETCCADLMARFFPEVRWPPEPPGSSS